MRFLVLSISLLCISQTLLGQLNCERNLNEARAAYASGNLYAIPGKLDECLTKGFSKNEKVEAYQLLALTYLNINQQDKAKETLIKLLKIKTDYQVVKNVDPDELYSLYQSIETDPIYYVGIYTGGNYTFATLPTSTDRFTTNSGEDDYNYEGDLSVNIGLEFMYPLSTVWLATGRIGYDAHRFNYTERNIGNVEGNNVTTVTYESINRAINLGVGLRYMYKGYNYKPFMELSLIIRYNASNRIADYTNTNRRETTDESGENYSINEFRKAFNFGPGLDAGTMIKVGENYLSVSIGAHYFLISETNYDNDNDRILNSLDSKQLIIEDNYQKFVVNFTIKFNMPFYNFK